MDSIFHEKQEGQLCAQHCLNNLLQEPYFTAVDLAKLASELDEAEKLAMAEAGFDSAEFMRFMEQPSSNMDDSGYFSVQVISKALSVWSLSMVPLSSPQMKHALEIPTSQSAFICNHQHHWFTVRKLGKQWFNLDSLQRRPELISDTYLKMFLTQLQMEGYSIFVVMGNLPTCEADQLFSLIPAVQLPSVAAGSSSTRKGKQKRSLLEEEEYEVELATAMSVSMVTAQKTSTMGKDPEVNIKDQSKTDSQGSKKEDSQLSAKPLSIEELRHKRLQHFKE